MKNTLKIKWEIYKNKDLEHPYYYNGYLNHLTTDAIQGRGYGLMRGYVIVFNTGHAFTYNASKGFPKKHLSFGMEEAQKLSGKNFGELLQEGVSKTLDTTIELIMDITDKSKIKDLKKYKHQLKI